MTAMRWIRPEDIVAATDAAGLPPVGGQAFRDCIARVPSGVNIVTTAGVAGTSGFTATAVASVSDDPPMVLVCLNRRSSQNETLKANGRFAVNLLPAGAQPLADAFAGRTGLSGEARFSHGTWTTLATGAPVLVGSVTSLDCVLAALEEVGTHTVFFGTVVGCSLTPVSTAGGPEILVYHDRHYAEV
ncbi:flavin reductase family protein [Oharaeibacter diazotrophicus]|uniref:Flavin reductase n=1 Tax=Oharaeibacter diazotrophicus TaxID=1920512 RepID=A0A4R6RNE7_9HYPH|nr:flavin reductase family protein [Oharaeibacter diazotrophicus]TDP87587.1 flavin reductase [Oharaeibacter diazotrophicus]BBE70469.1 FMN reductase (NADH) RutF [Pleomorphomonas sp. SM30]GLS77213.1 4-hydroxyphenylacetate 3-monooxygenase [Oharaeibacter diazotrophicus]